MKRVQAACICQTLHFFQKEEVPKTEAAKMVADEYEKYKKSLEQSHTVYKILEEINQDDGSIIVKIKKQYSTSPVGEYLN